MSVLTLITVLVVAYGLISRDYGRALALGGVTSAGTAFVAGAIVVPTFYAVAAGGLLVLAVGLVRDRRHDVPWANAPIPGLGLLLVFLAWSTMVTLVAPVLFDGLMTVTPTTRPLVAGLLTTSNIAQIIYIVLGIVVVVVLTRARSAGPEILGLSLGLGMALSLWRYFSQSFGVPFPEGILDNSPSLVFIEQAAGGIPRFRGIFSEPSALAGSAIVATAYGFSRAAHVTGIRRIGALALAGVAIFLGLVSTATTFVIAGVVMVIFVVAAFGLGFLSRRTRFSAQIGVIGCLLILASAWVLPWAAAAVSTVIEDKVQSDSFDDRTGADQASYGVFLETFGFGVGLGSGRASSFLPTLLSTSGLIGAMLFVAAIAAVVLKSMNIRPLRPVLWSLATLLVVKVIAGPDLADPTGILWMSLGVLCHGIVARPFQPDPVSLPDRRLRARRLVPVGAARGA